ncbi:MAG: hypothetical protein GY847_12930 [Proteobacteria bacterium]|nr:hypothetical protein [Pseudomonadota bacterium]
MTIHRQFRMLFIAIFFAFFTLVACDDDDDEDEACSLETGQGCPDGTVCERTAFGESETACFYPVVIRGKVSDLKTGDGIQGALVIARDANGAAMGSVAETEADGTYALPVATTRNDEEGGFEGAVLTLRVDAAGYASYPGGFRPSMPVDLDSAQTSDDDDNDDDDSSTELTVQTPTTDVALIRLPGDTENIGTISGVVYEGFGALVVAKGSSGAVTGVADAVGNYTIFNVPAGSMTLNAYASGKQYEPLGVDISTYENVTGADFAVVDRPTATVTGSVNIVNAPGDSVTSVVLVVEATFNDNFKRGEVPPGLRAGEVTGAFTIEGVPDGQYVVLAAFENDNLVRDPDTSIAGTQIVHIETKGGTLAVPNSFKVTEALEVKNPGAEAPEAVSGTPTIIWADDSSEDNYAVVVYDAFGQFIWEDDSVPRVTGSQWVEIEYGGPALEKGIFYQWRTTSIKKGIPISTTEDLRGLFYVSSFR